MNIKDIVLDASPYSHGVTPGREHYTLLAWFSTLFSNSVLFDIGTFIGMSARALSYNESNRVISYDISNQPVSNPPKNITFKIGDFRLDPELLTSPFILIDTAPHDGVQEREFYKFFIDSGYKGLILWDDIYYSRDMRSFWNEITHKKYDMTALGHHSGTGLVVF